MSKRSASQMGNKTSKELAMPEACDNIPPELDEKRDPSTLSTDPSVDSAGGQHVTEQLKPYTILQSGIPDHAIPTVYRDGLGNTTVANSRTTTQPGNNKERFFYKAKQDNMPFEGYFGTTPHPYAKTLTESDVVDIINDILDNPLGSPFNLLSALEKLKHGIIAPSILGGTPLLVALEHTLVFHPDNDVRLKVREVLDHVHASARAHLVALRAAASHVSQKGVSAQVGGQNENAVMPESRSPNIEPFRASLFSQQPSRTTAEATSLPAQPVSAFAKSSLLDGTSHFNGTGLFGNTDGTYKNPFLNSGTSQFAKTESNPKDPLGKGAPSLFSGSGLFSRSDGASEPSLLNSSLPKSSEESADFSGFPGANAKAGFCPTGLAQDFSQSSALFSFQPLLRKAGEEQTLNGLGGYIAHNSNAFNVIDTSLDKASAARTGRAGSIWDKDRPLFGASPRVGSLTPNGLFSIPSRSGEPHTVHQHPQPFQSQSHESAGQATNQRGFPNMQNSLGTANNTHSAETPAVGVKAQALTTASLRNTVYKIEMINNVFTDLENGLDETSIATKIELDMRNPDFEETYSSKEADELLEWAKSFLNADSPEFAVLRPQLQSFHAKTLAFKVVIVSIAEGSVQVREAVSELSTQIGQLETELDVMNVRPGAMGMPLVNRPEKESILACLHQQIKSWELRLTKLNSVAEKAQSAFLKDAQTPLQMFCRSHYTPMQQELQKKIQQIVSQSASMLKVEQEFEVIQTQMALSRSEISDLQFELSAMEAQCSKSQADCRIASDRVDVLSRGVTQREVDLQAKYREKMNEKLSDARQEKELAIQATKYKYEAQIQDAQAKSLQYEKATFKIDELGRQIKSFEQEKTRWSLAKIALEKRYHDLENQVKRLRDFEDAYTQLKEELEQIQNASLDTEAERDDLKMRVQELEAAASTASQNQPKTVDNRTSTGGHVRPGDEHINGLKQLWEKDHKSKMEAIKSKRVEIAQHDAKIAALRQPVQSSLPPKARPDSVPLPAVDVSRIHPLDVGVVPLAQGTAAEQSTARDGTEQRVDVNVVRSGPGPSQPRTWAAAAAGRR